MSAQSPQTALVVSSKDQVSHEIYSAYEKLEHRFQARWTRSPRATYRSMLNFDDALRLPIHRWYRFKEGFSPRFVQGILERFPPPSPDCYVLDPFCGVGTTLVESIQRGFSALGFEVNPFAAFVARLKTASWSKAEICRLQRVISRIEGAEPKDGDPAPPNKTVVSYFAPDTLEQLLRWKRWINVSTPPGLTRDAAKLGWLQAAEGLSLAYKAGNGLKRRKRTNTRNEVLLPNFIGHRIRTAIRSLLMQVAEDIRACPNAKSGRALVFEDTSLKLGELANVPLGLCVTSPPYANCFDYTKIYLCELWLGDFIDSVSMQNGIRLKSVRSHVHFSWPKRGVAPKLDVLDLCLQLISAEVGLWNKRIPEMLRGYFSDLCEVLTQMKDKMVPGAVAVFAISNPVYAGIPVAVDLLLGKLAELTGYQVLGIEVDRGIIPSSQQYGRIGDGRHYVRESNVIVQRP